MKILYYVEKKDTLMFNWQKYHFFDELSQYGIDIELFDYLSFENANDANIGLLDRINDNDIDLFMTPLSDDKIFIQTLKKIKDYRIPSLLICFDNLVIPFAHKKICRYFDLVWLTSSETEYLFKRWGANSIFLPYAANPSLFKLNENRIEEEKICFVGSPYGSRVNIINLIINHGICVDLFCGLQSTSLATPVSLKLKIKKYIKPFLNLIRFSYGRTILLGALKNKFLKHRELKVENNKLKILEPVPLNELGYIYSSYALSLSSTSARNTGVLKKPLEIINLRSFEIPMAGGIQVCKYNEELALYFENDKEIILYKDDKELIEKLEYYLLPENKPLRDKMKIAARLRAKKEHSWYARFKIIFDRLDLSY